jgi:hypothetical protein
MSRTEPVVSGRLASLLGWLAVAGGCADPAASQPVATAPTSPDVTDACFGTCGTAAPDTLTPPAAASDDAARATESPVTTDAESTAGPMSETPGPGADARKTDVADVPDASDVIVGCVPQEVSTRYDATWLFGVGCRADWDSTDQLTVQPSPVRFAGFEGTITAANAFTGALFAASDGIDLYDAGGVKTNSAPLGANVTTSQAVAFIGRPGSESDFYLVANAANESGAAGLYITTLSCGAVTPSGPPELLPGTDTFTEALATVRHANGTDRWVVSIAPDGVAAVPLTAAGFGVPVVSSWNGALEGVNPAQRTSVVFARDRRTIAITAEQRGLVVGTFDTATGTASGLEAIPLPPHTYLYSAAFSADQSKLYVSEWAGRFWQVDRTGGNAVTDLGAAGGAVRLAIDQRVYVAQYSTSALTVVTNPDAPAGALAVDSVPLPDGCTSSYGFPGVGDL